MAQVTKLPALSIQEVDIKINGTTIAYMTNVEVSFKSDVKNEPVLSSRTRVTRKGSADYTFTAETIKMRDEVLKLEDLIDKPFLMEAMETNPETGAIKTTVIPDCEIADLGVTFSENSTSKLSGNCSRWYTR